LEREGNTAGVVIEKSLTRVGAASPDRCDDDPHRPVWIAAGPRPGPRL
jgi:hypothetical protein